MAATIISDDPFVIAFVFPRTKKGYLGNLKCALPSPPYSQYPFPCRVIGQMQKKRVGCLGTLDLPVWPASFILNISQARDTYSLNVLRLAEVPDSLYCGNRIMPLVMAQLGDDTSVLRVDRFQGGRPRSDGLYFLEMSHSFGLC